MASESGATVDVASRTLTGVPIVVDLGSGTVKAGFATDATPRSVVPTAVLHADSDQWDDEGRTGVRSGMRGGDVAVGKRALVLFAERRHVPEGRHDGKADGATAYGGDLKRPIERGTIVDHYELEHVLHKSFLALRAASDGHPLLLTEPVLVLKSEREKLLQMAFETYRAPAAYVSSQASLALHTTGRTTGCVLESGEGVTQIVPVFEGYALQHASRRVPVAGQDITALMQGKLIAAMRSAHPSALAHVTTHVAQEVKEKCARVRVLGVSAEPLGRSDADEGTANREPPIETYRLPDGTLVGDGLERVRCAEVLFDTSLLALAPATTFGACSGHGSDGSGVVATFRADGDDPRAPKAGVGEAETELPPSLPAAVHAAIRRAAQAYASTPAELGSDDGGKHADDDYVELVDGAGASEAVRDIYYSNVVLAGGNTLLPGFAARMKHELVSLVNEAAPKSRSRPSVSGKALGARAMVTETHRHTVKVAARTDRGYAAWRGGASLAGAESFARTWVTKAEYDEIGPGIVHRKCF